MNRIVVFTLVLTNIIIAQSVEIHGALKSVMQGDLKAKYDLEDLKGQQNIYGLGAIENLKGEIIVINSKPYISQLLGKEISIDTTFNHKASLFAFSQISSWVSDSILGSKSLGELEKVVSQKSIDSKHPLSFLLTGML